MASKGHVATKTKVWPRRHKEDDGKMKVSFPPTPTATEKPGTPGDVDFHDTHQPPSSVGSSDAFGDISEGSTDGDVTIVTACPGPESQSAVRHGRASVVGTRNRAWLLRKSGSAGRRLPSQEVSPRRIDQSLIGTSSSARANLAEETGEAGAGKAAVSGVTPILTPPSSPRLRHPRHPGSPETAYRSAVRAYLAPPARSAAPDTKNGGGSSGSGSQSPAVRRSRSMSPGASQRSQWCSPTRPPTSPVGGSSDWGCNVGVGDGGGSSGMRGAGGGGAAGPSSPDTVVEREGVPPLLLAPADWGIGLGGEWVSARRVQTSRAVGRVSLTWADIRGNTLLHLAAQHNDVALVQAVLRCEKRRRKAVKTRNSRRERVLERVRQWNVQSMEAASARKQAKVPVLKTKDILRRIKEDRAEEERTIGKGARNVSQAVAGVSHQAQSSGAVDDYIFACENWLPLQSEQGDEAGDAQKQDEGGEGGGGRSEESMSAAGGRSGCACGGGPHGRAPWNAHIVATLRAVLLEESHVRQVVRLAGMYMVGDINEAEWYHRTAVILPGKSAICAPADLLVEIAAAHPSDCFLLKKAKGAIQDYAEEERSSKSGGYWMDRGINDALDLNARNLLSETPLIVGTQNASVEVVSALCEQPGTDVAAVNEDGCTSLVIATMLEKTAVIKVLVAAYGARGIGVDHRTTNGFSALHWAVVRGNADATIDLVDAGAAVNAGRTEGRQMWRLPIHKCAEYGSVACLQVLLRAGADPLVEDKLGMTAMHIAASKGFLEFMQALSVGGDYAAAVSVNVISKKNGKTPLHYAIESLQLEVVRFILGRGRWKSDVEGRLDDVSSPSGRRDRESEAIRHLAASQRTKLEVMLTAAAKEEQGVLASGIASLKVFVQSVFT